MVGCFYKYFPSLRGKYILLPLPWGKTHSTSHTSVYQERELLGTQAPEALRCAMGQVWVALH